MKKIYVQPETEEIVLDVQPILAGTNEPYEEGNSVPGINFDDDGE